MTICVCESNNNDNNVVIMKMKWNNDINGNIINNNVCNIINVNEIIIILMPIIILTNEI